MPCRDYESDAWGNSSSTRETAKLKNQADKLARFACAAMDELEANGIAEVLLLKNDELRAWWVEHKEADRKEKARAAELQRREAVKQEALNKLSDEEKELLGLKKPKTKAKAVRHDRNTFFVDAVSEDEDVEEEMDYETFLKSVTVR